MADQGRSVPGDEFLAGVGGEMGRRMRQHDWSATPLGPIGGWPQSLRTAVRLVLGSRYPMFVWWGPDLINFYNDDYIPVLGQRHPEALGRPAAATWADIWDTVGPQAEAVLRQGVATWNEERLLVMERHGYPEETYFTFSYSPAPDDAGGIGGVFCACTDETQRVLSRRRLRALREVAARATGVRTADDACRAAAEALTGNPYDVPFGLIYLVDGDDGPARLCAAAGLPEGAPSRPERVGPGDGDAGGWPLFDAAGGPVVVDDLAGRFGPILGAWPEPVRSACVLPLMQPGQGRLGGFLVAGISPRRAFDDDYRGFLDLLAGQIATAISDARAYEAERERAESLAELDRAKTNFFSNVSHEFRTPLTLLMGPIEDVLGDVEQPPPPRHRERLALAHRNALRLQKLVNTLLEFSRIEAGRVRSHYVPTDLAALTTDLASNFRSACERAGLDFRVDCPPLPEPVYVDREMWERIVLNLLSNAFKFTLRGKIEVSVRSLNGSALLAVRDTGVGIPAEALPHLFERFHRVEDDRGRSQEGSGIGLALVRELVGLHGGKAWAESEPGVGSAFFASVPLGVDHLPAGRVGPAPADGTTALSAAPFVEEALRWLPEPDAGEPSARPPSAPGGRPRVLLADDNADMRDYVRRLLAPLYEVEAVPDGRDALERARDRPPDLVLADVMMPGLDGFALLRALRDGPRTRELPVVLLSARAGADARVEGLEAGADEYLTKPFSAAELLARVGACLHLAKIRREAEDALRASQELLNAALAASDTGTYRWDPNTGRFLEVDDNLRRLFGMGPGDPSRVTEDFLARIHPDDLDGVFAAVDRCRQEGADFDMEFRVSLTGGGLRWIYDRGKMVRDAEGRPAYLVGACTDITKRKRVEEELREADRRKDEFLATLAHELRNPLAPIRTALHLMAEPDPDGRHHEPERAMAERQAVHLARLVEDLMDVARINRGKIELRKQVVELGPIVRHAVEVVRPSAADRGQALGVALPERPVWLEADPTRLEQVLDNLLTNAVKYTEPGGRIDLAVAPGAGTVTIRVRDTGVGIPAEMLPRVFEMFTQVGQHADRSRGGLGIGLGLVRSLVEMHGGAIVARSAGLGAGSEFEVTLPTLVGPAPPAAAGPDRLAPGRVAGKPLSRRVLVVDDNVDAATSLAKLLARSYGQEVRVAHDGPTALGLAESFRPEVVLLDIGMPGMDGYEVARHLRAGDAGRPPADRPLLVALTGWGQDADRRKSSQAGFDRHLIKPVEPDALRAVLAGAPPAG